jgi:hypothetical protein
MIAFLDPLNGDDWLARADVMAMLKKHESYLIIDAYGEPQYDDRDQWRAEAIAALQHYRDLGYLVPLTVTANQFGRDLPSLLVHGDEILAADPLDNAFLGWQAYWGQGGYYQDTYGMTLSEAVVAIVDSGLPIQMGLDFITDLPDETADYQTLMTEAQAHGIGWLWWDFFNPYGWENDLSEDGTASNLSSMGSIVLKGHAASIANTAHLRCSGEVGPFSLNAGGDAAGAFVADTGFEGGHLAPQSRASIDRSLVPAPQPAEAVYQTERWGVMKYRIGGYEPNSVHDVDLHFAETYFGAAGQRKFHVNIGTKRKLTSFDIFAATGAKNRAIVKTVTGRVNADGEIVISFIAGSADQPKIDGIVIH